MLVLTLCSVLAGHRERHKHDVYRERDFHHEEYTGE